MKESFRHIKWAQLYIQYVGLRNRGLKKQSMIALVEFIKDFTLQSKEQKRSFLDEVYHETFRSKEYSTYLPQNLVEQVFKPEIKNWIDEEPHNVIPYRWSYDLQNLKKAVEISPTDQISLVLFGEKLIGRVSMNQHEIQHGYGYDGDPQADLELISFFENKASNISDISKRNELMQQLTELRNVALKFT